LVVLDVLLKFWEQGLRVVFVNHMLVHDPRRCWACGTLEGFEVGWFLVVNNHKDLCNNDHTLWRLLHVSQLSDVGRFEVLFDEKI
jgi:hypothetical protein